MDGDQLKGLFEHDDVASLLRMESETIREVPVVGQLSSPWVVPLFLSHLNITVWHTRQQEWYLLEGQNLVGVRRQCV
jgi:hypothetical protein